MPEVVALIVEAAVFVGTHIGPLFAGAYGAFAQTLAFSAAFTGGSYAIRALIPKPSLPNFNNLANQQISVRQSIQPREIVVGKVKKGGTLFLLEMSGSSNEYRHIGLLLSGHQMAGVDETWLDDKQVFFDGAGDATGDFAGFVYQEVHLGDPADTTQPFPRLAAELPARWGSTDLIRGCGKVHLRIKLDPNKFPSGLPNPKFVIRGALLYDPRSSTTAYSNNAALASRYYATLDRNKGGYGIPTAELDDSLVIAAANISDENVALAAGGTEKRYTANGIITTDNDPKQAMLGLLTAMAGDMYCIGGIWRMYAGAWIAPTAAAITASDFRGDMQWNPIASVADSFNAVKGVYVSPQNEYQASDFPPVTNSTYETEDGGRIFKDITLPFTDSPSRAQRIAKIVLEGSRRAGRGSLPLKLTQLNLCAPDVIPVTFSDFGWSSKTLQISRSALGVDQAGRNRYAYGTDLEVKETDANVYAWSTADETTPGASVAANPGDISIVQPITSLSLSNDSVPAANGKLTQRLLASWTAPTDQLVTAGGKILVSYKKHADVTWIALPPFDGATTQIFISPVQGGTAYDLKVIAQNAAGAKSVSVEQDNFTVPIETGEAIGVGKNILKNGGFESNNIGTVLGAFLNINDPCSDDWYTRQNDNDFWRMSYDNVPRSGAWDISTQLKGSAGGSVSVPNDSVLYWGRFATVSKIIIAVGDIVRVSGWRRWENTASPPAGVSIAQTIGLMFFDASDNFIGELDAIAVNSPQASYAFMQAALQVPATMTLGRVPAYARAFVGGFVQNTSGAAFVTGSNDYAILRFDDVKVVLQNTPFDLTPGSTSGRMIGGPALSQSGVTSTILIAAKSFQFGDGVVSYNSGSINPGYGSWYIYADDPTYAGGAVTFVATATESNIYAAPGRVPFGFITITNTGTTAGPTTGGTGGGVGKTLQ
jgi:hypothetical protein